MYLRDEYLVSSGAQRSHHRLVISKSDGEREIVLTRRMNESILIGEDIEVVLSSAANDRRGHLILRARHGVPRILHGVCRVSNWHGSMSTRLRIYSSCMSISHCEEYLDEILNSHRRCRNDGLFYVPRVCATNRAAIG